MRVGCSDYATIFTIGNCDSIPSGGKGYFIFSKVSGPALGSTQPLIYLVPRALSPGIKRPEHETDQQPSFIAEVNTNLAIPVLPHMPS
jgi:hypothetical protein